MKGPLKALLRGRAQAVNRAEPENELLQLLLSFPAVIGGEPHRKIGSPQLISQEIALQASAPVPPYLVREASGKR
jgi:hypothetical protein